MRFSLLGEWEEIEITQQQDKLIITTIEKKASIWDLGKNPVECDVNDSLLRFTTTLKPQS